MKPQIENLKALISLRELTIRQKADAVNEYKALMNYVKELEQQLELYLPKTLGEDESIGLPYKKIKNIPLT